MYSEEEMRPKIGYQDVKASSQPDINSFLLIIILAMLIITVFSSFFAYNLGKVWGSYPKHCFYECSNDCSNVEENNQKNFGGLI